jgi:hypothetical protein
VRHLNWTFQYKTCSSVTESFTLTAVKVKLSLCTWLGGGIAPIVLSLVTTWKWVANSTFQPLHPVAFTNHWSLSIRNYSLTPIQRHHVFTAIRGGKSKYRCNKALMFADFHGRLVGVALYRGLPVYSEVQVIEKLNFNARGWGGIACDLFERSHISVWLPWFLSMRGSLVSRRIVDLESSPMTARWLLRYTRHTDCTSLSSLTAVTYAVRRPFAASSVRYARHRQCMCRPTVRRVRLTTVVLEKQQDYIFERLRWSSG